MISNVEADKINQWLKKFQKEHGNTMIVNYDVIEDLACALCDDIPLGYEASHRLANWLFCYLHTQSSKESEKQQHIEDVNAELRKLAKDLHALTQDVLPERKSDYITIRSVELCIDYYSKTMPAIEDRMRKLGIEVPK